MRPHPLVPSPRRTLATLAALLISAALSLGFAPLPANLLLGSEEASSTLAKEPCGVEKVAAAGAEVTTANAFGSSTSPAVHAATPAASTSTQPTAGHEIPAARPIAQVPTAGLVGLLESCPGVRPGGIVTSEAGMCTYNFVFNDGEHDYIGTAGHCVLDTPQVSSSGLPLVEQSWAPGKGPVAMDAEGQPVGRFIYGIRSDAHDFALIRLDHGVLFSPQMCYFGGPTGINNDLVAEPATLHFYGNGQGISAVAPARSAVTLDMRDPNEVFAFGLGAPVAIPGDSGAPVTTEDGRAVGNISSDVVGLGTIGRGVISIPRIGPPIARAEQALRRIKAISPQQQLRLVTAPLG